MVDPFRILIRVHNRFQYSSILKEEEEKEEEAACNMEVHMKHLAIKSEVIDR